MKDRARGNLLDVVVVFDVATTSRVVDGLWHTALGIQVEAARQRSVEPVIVPEEQSRLEW